MLQQADKNRGVEEEDGNVLLISTQNCVLRLALQNEGVSNNPKVELVLGNCYESGIMRDGPILFARFYNLQMIVGSFSSSFASYYNMIILDTQTRIGLVQKNDRVVSIFVPSPIQTMASGWQPSNQSTYLLYLPVAWLQGGISLLSVYQEADSTLSYHEAKVLNTNNNNTSSSLLFESLCILLNPQTKDDEFYFRSLEDKDEDKHGGRDHHPSI